MLEAIIGILTGKAGEKIGAAVSWAAQIAALAAALAPVALFVNENRDAVFLTVTYGQMAFWGVLMGAGLFLVVRLVHYARPPGG